MASVDVGIRARMPDRSPRTARWFRVSPPGRRAPGPARSSPGWCAHTAATAPSRATTNAAVFCAVHNLMQCPAALGKLFDHVRPGAPVA